LTTPLAELRDTSASAEFPPFITAILRFLLIFNPSMMFVLEDVDNKGE